MNKIVNLKQAEALSKELRSKNKKLVITGGCFDILHLGHIKLFEKSKKQGDSLLVLIENDKTVAKIKGQARPINPQKDRAEMIAAISYVDYVLIMPDMKSNSDYDKLIIKLNPGVITTTAGNPQAIHNKRQAALIHAKVIFATRRIHNKSTTRLAEIIHANFK